VPRNVEDLVFPVFLACFPVAAAWFLYLLGLLDLLSVHAITIHSGKLL